MYKYNKAKHNLGFYTGQILWDGHISHSNHLVSMLLFRSFFTGSKS